MESAFINQYGSFEEKLIASLMAANVSGADTRCEPYGTPAISAFIKIAKLDNSIDSLFLDLNVNNAALTLNPLDSLFSLSLGNSSLSCSLILNSKLASGSS